MPVTEALLEDGCQETDGPVTRLSAYLCQGSGDWVADCDNRLGAVLNGEFDNGYALRGTPRTKVFGTWKAPANPILPSGMDVNGCGGFPVSVATPSIG